MAGNWKITSFRRDEAWTNKIPHIASTWELNLWLLQQDDIEKLNSTNPKTKDKSNKSLKIKKGNKSLKQKTISFYDKKCKDK